MNTILYADLFLIINTIINGSLLFLCLFTNKMSVKINRIALSALFGAVSSLFIIFLPTGIAVTLKFLTAVVMCQFLTKASIKQTIKTVCTFYIYSFVLSGITTAFGKVNQIINIGRTAYNSVPTTIMFCSLILLYILSNNVIKLVGRQAAQRNLYKSVVITYNGKSISMIGFCDSGNQLRNPTDELPIYIIDKKVFEKFPLTTDNCLFTIPYNTISGSGEIMVFKPDRISIDNITVKALVGICNHEIGSDYDILLHYNHTETPKKIETENIYV